MEKTLTLFEGNTIHVFPGEDKKVILHNPEMGWALYDNHAMIARPLPSGEAPVTGRYENHLTLREDDYDYPGVDNIVLIFTWSDIEIEKAVYDFTYFDAIYDFWKKKGRNIVLGLSTETKVWYGKHGQGAPDYILEYLGEEGVQVRSTVKEGKTYHFYLCDIGNPYYLERMGLFLNALNDHMKETNRPVHYMDLRTFGIWGEGHTGFVYPNLERKHKALSSAIEVWAKAFPKTYLALSYSYDPDEPYENYNDPNRYKDFLEWSAFDVAMQYPNITIRRDGAGQEVKNCERMFCEDMFRPLTRGPFTAEGCNGYDPRRTVEYIVTDGLSLHPNFFTVVGWGGSEARRFLEDYPDLYEHALRHMGYRFVITHAMFSKDGHSGNDLHFDVTWVNRANGRMPWDALVEIMVKGVDRNYSITLLAGMSNSSKWVKDAEYDESYSVSLPTDIPAGAYSVGLALFDPKNRVYIKTPLLDKLPGTEFCMLGNIRIV